jgi:aspartate carbamoyltransferase catalytic subunit
MEIAITMQVKVCLPDDGPIPIEKIVSSLKDQKIEAKLVEEIITTADVRIVTALCGERYSNNGEPAQYSRAGTSKKTIITSLGSSNLKFVNNGKKMCTCYGIILYIKLHNAIEIYPGRL